MIISPAGYLDSNSEDSDSDLSDVAELDSDIEREKEKDYDRAVYKEDLNQLKRMQKQQKNSSTVDGQKRNQAPSEGIKLEFIHGWGISLGFCILSNINTQCSDKNK